MVLLLATFPLALVHFALAGHLHDPVKARAIRFRAALFVYLFGHDIKPALLRILAELAQLVPWSLVPCRYSGV
ncbi:MAG: hypothetical protein O7D32_00870 [bacterium]|nr:hypothetical protein [bacterium]